MNDIDYDNAIDFINDLVYLKENEKIVFDLLSNYNLGHWVVLQYLCEKNNGKYTLINNFIVTWLYDVRYQ